MHMMVPVMLKVLLWAVVLSVHLVQMVILKNRQSHVQIIKHVNRVLTHHGNVIGVIKMKRVMPKDLCMGVPSERIVMLLIDVNVLNQNR